MPIERQQWDGVDRRSRVAGPAETIEGLNIKSNKNRAAAKNIFLKAYCQSRNEKTRIIPKNETDLNLLLRSFLLEKAVCCCKKRLGDNC